MHKLNKTRPSTDPWETPLVTGCPGLGQDRVNFHQNPGRGTAGWADPTPPGQAEPGIPYHVPVRLGSGGGEWHGGN